MGKKKNIQRGQKVKKPTPITNTPPIESVANGESSEAAASPVVVVNRDSMFCSHIEKGINLDVLSSKICPAEYMKCNDCSGGKSNRVKTKKGSKSETKAIWVCLECGNFSCGGVGMPSVHSHAMRHSRQCRHALAVHYDKHQLFYCFRCDRIVGGRKTEEYGAHKEVLSEVSKRMKKGWESESIDVEDVWFGSGKKIGTKDDYSVSGSGGNNDGKGYGVRGLVNLGNTCFFNSVLQNLFALSSLRDYIVDKLDGSVGPLSGSLKKLFLETGGEGVVKGAVNPKNLFTNVCNKAPMFKGFQQQDSHELLRFLIDGLSNEELSARKRDKGDSGEEASKEPTFVDALFGGKLISIVTCLECSVPSTTYESFLDLSLSFPTKKSPSPSVKPQLVTRGKKPKLPPRRSARIRNKNNSKEVLSFSTGGSVSENGDVEPRVQTEQLSLPSLSDTVDSDTMVLDMDSDMIDANAMAFDMGLTPQDFSAIQNPSCRSSIQTSEKSQPKSQPDVDDTFWLDFVEPTSASETIDKIHINWDDDVAGDDDVALQIALESSMKNNLEHVSEKQQNDVCDSFAQLDLVNQSTNEDAIHSHVSQVTQDSGLRSDSEINVAEVSIDDKSLKQGLVAHHQIEVSVDKDEKSLISRAEYSQLNVDLVHSSVSCDKLLSDPDIKEDDTSSKVNVPNKEDTDYFSAVINDEEDSSNFGLCDMFNEPESIIQVGHAENAPVVISSDSDPGEVDNANSPVSVESCLYLYIKTEQLNKDEHAWKCDHCSKIVREQMIAKMKAQTTGTEILLSDCDGRNGVIDEFHEKSQSQISEWLPNENVMPEIELNVISCQTDTVMHNKINESHGISPEPSEKDENEKLEVSRDASKKILINSAPSILTITLKRFLPDARGRLSKVTGHVIFGQTMDLKPYMDPRCVDRDSYRYQLVGVVEHSGTMRGGHYVAYVRGTTSGGSCAWYNVSDVYVRQVSLEEVLSSEAYILFYELI